MSTNAELMKCTSLAEAQDIARDILSHTIGINQRCELALPEDKLKSYESSYSCFIDKETITQAIFALDLLSLF